MFTLAIVLYSGNCTELTNGTAEFFKHIAVVHGFADQSLVLGIFGASKADFTCCGKA